MTLEERIFPANIAALHEVLAFSEEKLEQSRCPVKLIMQINIAVEEIFVNIANYAYGEEKGQMRLGIGTADGRAEFRFTDWGIPFDPTARSDPDVSLPAEKREVGGLGIFMTKKIMDEVEYRRLDGKNILTLNRKFG